MTGEARRPKVVHVPVTRTGEPRTGHPRTGATRTRDPWRGDTRTARQGQDDAGTGDPRFFKEIGDPRRGDWRVD